MNAELPPFKNGEHNSEVRVRQCHNPFKQLRKVNERLAE